MSKKPYMPFYIGDYKKDIEVQSLDRYCRNIWLDLMCLMWESHERGVLVIGGKPMARETIARVIGEDNQNFEICLSKILDNGCFDVREDGAIFSRRMVRENEISVKRSISGSQGGNPNLVKQNSSKPPSKTQANADIDIDNVIDTDLNNYELAVSGFDTAQIRHLVDELAKKFKNDGRGRVLQQQTVDSWQSQYALRIGDFIEDAQNTLSKTKAANLIPLDRSSPVKKQTTKDFLRQEMEKENAKMRNP